MSSFSAIETRKPPSFVVVPPNAFADEWSDRPSEKVAIGLRLIPQEDIDAARAQAAERANSMHKDVDLLEGDRFNAQLWLDAYEDALMTWIVARAMCDPNDALSSWEPFRSAPEDMTRQYLTSSGVTFIFDAWEAMRISADPVHPEISVDETSELVELLKTHLPHAGRIQAARARRLLAFVHRELSSVIPPKNAA